MTNADWRAQQQIPTWLNVYVSYWQLQEIEQEQRDEMRLESESASVVGGVSHPAVW